MAFLDWLTGKDTTKASSKIVGDTKTSGTKVQSQAGAQTTQIGTTSASTQETQQQQQTLDPAVQALLAQMIGQAGAGGGGATGDEVQAVAETLLARAGETQQFVDERTGDIVAAREQTGQRQVEQTATANQRAAGSSFNTLAQQAQQQAQNELNVSLAGLESELGLAGRELETQALAQAFDALTQSGELGAGAGLEGLRVAGGLAQVLKGAQTSGSIATDTTAEQQETQNTLNQLLSVLQETQSGQTVQTQSGKQKQTGGILDLVPLLFS